MRRTCPMCRRPQEAEESFGVVCARCDKVADDAEAELALMSGRVAL